VALVDLLVALVDLLEWDHRRSKHYHRYLDKGREVLCIPNWHCKSFCYHIHQTGLHIYCQVEQVVLWG
jgi:hypothetical protein